MAQTCTSCGKPLPDRSKFCPSCGAPRPGANAVVGTRVRFAEAGEAALDLGTAATARAPRVAEASPVGAAREANPADFGQRFVAIIFDLLITLIAILVSTFVLSAIGRKSVVGSNSMLAAFYLVAAGLYAINFVVLAGRDGQTVGKRLIGIRILRENGAPAGYAAVAVRHFVGYLLSALAVGLGFLWSVWDEKRQGWHDKIARTIVVVSR